MGRMKRGGENSQYVSGRKNWGLILFAVWLAALISVGVYCTEFLTLAK